MNDSIQNKTPRHTGSKFGSQIRLAKKELLEILRDRRTIITLVMMPLLVYPLMGIVVQKLMLQNVGKNEDIIYRIAFEDKPEADQFAEVFRQGQQMIAQAYQGKEIPTLGTLQNPKLEFVFPDGEKSIADFIQTGEVDLGVTRNKIGDDNFAYQLMHNPGSAYSRNAMQFIGKRLRLVNNSFMRQLAGPAKLFKLPASYLETAVEVETRQPPSLLTFVPLMLVLMTITGAVYPAIDVTAGERERGTMEILVAAPVSRLSVLIGKFCAVFVVATLTAIANLFAMVVTIYALGIDVVIFGEAGVNLGSIGIIFILLLVLSGFFSATLLGLTSFARSFKEAQAYLIPLMLIAFAPGLISLTPNLQTSNFLAVVPLVNMVMVGRDLLAGNPNNLQLAIAIISTLLYGLVALSVAAKVFGTDALLMGGKSGWSDFFSRHNAMKLVPEIPNAMFFLAILFPAFVVMSGLSSNVAGKQNATIEQRLWINASVTVLLFVGLPWMFSTLIRLNLKTTFFHHTPSLTGIIAAVLLGTSVWMFAYEIEIYSLSSNRMEEFIKIFEDMRISLNQVPLWVKLVCLAATPAICEELTFRGFLLCAFAKRFPPAASIVITAVLFGLFHVFVRDLLMFERMIPSTFMGLLLGFVCLRTGSIYPGILLHLIHNGLLITLEHHEELLIEWGIGITEQEHLPLSLLGAAAIPISIGILLLIFASRKPEPIEKPLANL